MELLSPIVRLMHYYKSLGEQAMAQVPDEALLNYHPNENSNSIALIVKHLHGNMLSRWTDFLTSDGEKEWRNRDSEFEGEVSTRKDVMELWNAGWACALGAIEQLTEADLTRTVYIRNQAHTVYDALLRQLGHYPYHVGQIVYIAKMVSTDGAWQSLSIPKNKSAAYNATKFDEPKNDGHFTDEFVKKV